MKSKLFVIMIAIIFSLSVMGCSTDDSAKKPEENNPKPEVGEEVEKPL
jgi:uncharacterized lipoprotein YehR (DUF1307 family)